ncbi:MAG: DivIVA domain-containing protein [Streptococcaceae bacterium]|jgi:cell division initiation protein|nr:DivIVA domain-containing protein [Streptococcaceae bacterium]
MALNSLDVQNKTFNAKFRGYDRQEVDEFLEIIIRDYDEMTQKIKDQERDIKAMQERLTDFDNMKDSLNRSILVAQETADNVKTQAELNAGRINREAGQRADQIVDASHREARQILQSTYDEARRLVNESDELKRGMRSYYQRITMLMEGQLANIKSSDWEEILKPSPIYVGDTEEKLRDIIEHTNQNFMPINEKGEEVVREGEKAPETLESFANALNPETITVMPETVEVKEEPETESEVTNPENGEKPDPTINLGGTINFGN